MDFGEVLGTAWKIIWKHKVLWIFGILAGCSSARSGGGGSNSGYRFNSNNGSGGFPNQPEILRFLQSVPTWVWVAVVFAFLLLFILALFLGTIGRIGLIRGAIQADEGAARLSFTTLFRESLPYFWRVFLLNFLLGLLALILFLSLIVPSILAIVVTRGIGAIAAVPLMCTGILCLVLLFWVLGMIIEQVTVAIVAEDLSLSAGVQRGWSVFRANLGSVVVIALIIAIGGAIAGFIIGIPFLIILIPVAIGAVSGSIFQGSPFPSVGFIVAAIIFATYLPIAILLGGILQSYIGTLWTLTFRRLTGRKALAKPDLPMGAAVY